MKEYDSMKLKYWLKQIGMWIFIALWCMIWYRIRGGWLVDIPRPIPQLAFLVPLFLLTETYLMNWKWQILVMLFAWAGVSTGHGQYLPMGQWEICQDPETLDFIVQLFMGDDNCKDYWRDFAGMFTTSMFTVLGLFSLGFYKMIYASKTLKALMVVIVSLLIGLAKPVAYTLGHEFYIYFRFLPDGLRAHVEISELIYGLLFGILIGYLRYKEKMRYSI